MRAVVVCGARHCGPDAAYVGAGVPAKNSTRWLAPAGPVFAGTPAPTETVPVRHVALNGHTAAP
ncbi:protein of unknown function [Pseudomonas inefficax]|uniref:Uncharacterized protein n=1 Tax=Pseudomonas inefficax TaxID=2078786 RepID=A0AAQ1P5N0_9PSED|nr:protein of unknown function [Pseudomonas inefficax]